MEYDLVIKNGTVVGAKHTMAADVAVKGEMIAAIGDNLHGKNEIDASGKLVTPGAIDVHVHLEMPIGDFTSADDFFTGTRAAAFGGTTSIIDFVEARPDQPLLEALQERQALADQRAAIDFGLHMTIGPEDIKKLDQVSAVVGAGCYSFKLYMAYGLRLTDGQLLLALEAVKEAGGFPVVHAENWDVITTLIARNLSEGRTEPAWHPRSRPAMMEGEAAGRVIDLAALADTPLYIFHVSCHDVVERIAAARTRGLPIFGETCPQYLLLDETMYQRPGVQGALPVCSPPLRPKAEQEALWRALAVGQLQVVSTDHCPFTAEEKESRLDNFSTIPGGVPSIESRFPLMYSYGVRPGYLTPSQWVDRCCTTPARLFGMRNKGNIAVGYDADLVIFDSEEKRTLQAATLNENVSWTPYEGLELTGWPEVTISRGEIIAADGHFLASPGRGRYLKRR